MHDITRRLTTTIVRLCLFVGLAALAGVNAQAQSGGYAGEKVCLGCHTQENAHYSETGHASAFRANPANDLERRGCEACHGPGAAHAKSSGDKSLIVGFTRSWGTPPDQQASQCLSCHSGGNRMHWPGSIHASNQLSCADCHNPMMKGSAAGLLVRPTINEVCQNCHRQQRSEFMKRSHMPLPEGKMSCVDCHNPHGTVTRPLLKTDNVNSLCYSCHAEKRGPFLWEHAPVRENCLNCHSPHGSNQDKLLASPRPQLCQQCHGQLFHPSTLWNVNQTIPGAAALGGAAAPSPRVMGRSCLQCHSQVHGSNHPAGTRLQR